MKGTINNLAKDKIANKIADNWKSLLFLLILSLCYLGPGCTALISGDQNRVMSDGSDPATLPYNYAILLNHLKENTSYLFYGAVPTDRLNPPEGFAIWFPWIEKLFISLGSPFFPIEQLSTFFVLCLFILNGWSFYSLGRKLHWNKELSTALAICWAFCPYTIARSHVHMALAGTYFLPLVFWAIFHLKETAVDQSQSWRAFFISSLSLLLAAMAAQYYIIIFSFLSPFLIYLIYKLHTNQKNRLQHLLRFTLASTPAILLLIWTLARPIPPHLVKEQTVTYAKTGETENGQRHPFLTRFASSPIDYFTGHLNIESVDLNVVRGAISRSVLSHLDGSNPHERTNGIRWSIWLCVITFVVLAFKKRIQISLPDIQIWWLVFWGAFSGFSFWLSLEPLAFGFAGPSAWLASLISQFRVSSRAGIFVHFGLLLIVGHILQTWIFSAQSRVHDAKKNGMKITKKTSLQKSDGPLWPTAKKILSQKGFLIFIALLEFPPFLFKVPMSSIVAERKELTKNTHCGTVLYYPYISGTWALLEYYYFLQSMRGSSCQILNAVSDTVSDRNRRFMQIMPLHEKYLQIINQNSLQIPQELKKLADCTPLNWIVFDPRVSDSLKTVSCQGLGGTMVSKDTCKTKAQFQESYNDAGSCL